MKLRYPYIFFVVLFFSFLGCKKQSKNNSLEKLDTPSISAISLVEKFNQLPIDEKITLYNKMIADNQSVIIPFFKEKGCVAFLKKFATQMDLWTADVENLINIENGFFVGAIPLYGIALNANDPVAAILQYVNFFPTMDMAPNILFITFYSHQKNNLENLEIKPVSENSSSLGIFMKLKNGQGATIQTQTRTSLFQYTIKNPFIFDSTLFPNINNAIQHMLLSVE